MGTFFENLAYQFSVIIFDEGSSCRALTGHTDPCKLIKSNLFITHIVVLILLELLKFKMSVTDTCVETK